MTNEIVEDTKPCPNCGEQIKQKAIVCKHCKGNFSPTIDSQISGFVGAKLPVVVSELKSFREKRLTKNSPLTFVCVLAVIAGMIFFTYSVQPKFVVISLTGVKMFSSKDDCDTEASRWWHSSERSTGQFDNLREGKKVLVLEFKKKSLLVRADSTATYSGSEQEGWISKEDTETELDYENRMKTRPQVKPALTVEMPPSTPELPQVGLKAPEVIEHHESVERKERAATTASQAYSVQQPVPIPKVAPEPFGTYGNVVPRDIIEEALKPDNANNFASIEEMKHQLNSIQKLPPTKSIEANQPNKLGLAALREKNYLEARENFNNAALLNPSDPKLLSNLGVAEMYLGELEAAQKHLYIAVGLAPTREVTWNDLGMVLAKKGEMSRAVSAMVIGYRVSDGKSRPFLESLSDNEDEAIRKAGLFALQKIATGVSEADSAKPSGSQDENSSH